jgi:hypothetical protein
MAEHTVDLVPAGAYWRDAYGILLESETMHDFTGRGIHNPHHRHTLQVWENKPANDGSGLLKSPDGSGNTSEPYTFLWSPSANVISAHPGEPVKQGPTLALGDVVTLKVHGYVIGQIQCRARSLHNPHGVLVDTASSASRQHFIDTGRYLTPAEAQEATS